VRSAGGCSSLREPRSTTFSTSTRRSAPRRGRRQRCSPCTTTLWSRRYVLLSSLETLLGPDPGPGQDDRARPRHPRTRRRRRLKPQGRDPGPHQLHHHLTPVGRIEEWENPKTHADCDRRRVEPPSGARDSRRPGKGAFHPKEEPTRSRPERPTDLLAADPS